MARAPVTWVCDFDGAVGEEEPTGSPFGETAISAQLPKGWFAFVSYLPRDQEGLESRGPIEHRGWMHACDRCAPLVRHALWDLGAALRFTMHPSVDVGEERPDAPAVPPGWVAIEYGPITSKFDAAVREFDAAVREVADDQDAP